MSKKKETGFPIVEEIAPPQEVAAPPATEEMPLSTEVILELPNLSEVEAMGYIPSHYEVRLEGASPLRKFMKKLTISLESREAKLADGRLVKGGGPAIIWLLEQAHAAMS